jgi:signal transduction histidine kinase
LPVAGKSLIKGSEGDPAARVAADSSGAAATPRRSKFRGLRDGFLGPVDTERIIAPAVMARSFAYLYGAGATLVLATLWLASPSDRFLPGMIAPPIIAYGVVALMLLRSEQVPIRLLQALPGFGAILITVIAYSEGTGSFHAYALLYFWVILSAFYFFDWRVALSGLVICGVGYAAVLLHHDGAPDRLLYWVMGAGTLLVAAGLLALLRERIQQLLGALRQSDSLKTTIIRSVSHDLRTPLTAIIAAGESSASPSLDSQTRREVSSVIVGEASRLADTLSNLLDMSRLEAGAATPRRTWCPIEEVIEVALDHLPVRERFEVSVDSSLSAVWADATQLERALSNILKNSSRYAGSDPVRVTATVDNGKVILRVRDKGPGLAREEQALIFEPFYRGSAQGEDHRGPGLGLAIARGFIETNGGRLWVESNLGAGTTFVVELPLAPTPTPQ